MPNFNVHLYREMRLYYPGITAANAEEAVRVADLKSTREAHHIEDCDAATIAALVDLEGNTDYDHSRLIDLDPKQSAIATLLTALAGLIDAIRAGRHTDAHLPLLKPPSPQSDRRPLAQTRRRVLRLPRNR